MSLRSSGSTGFVLKGLVVLSLAIAGCRTESGPRDGPADAGPSAEAPDVSIPSAGSPRGGAAGPGTGEAPLDSSEDPFRNFELSRPDATLETALLLPLRIENGTGVPIVLTAEAGDEPVYLDSLGAGDVLRIDLETRAPAVRIVWTSADGSSGGQVEVSDVADSVQIVRIVAAGAVR